MANAIGRRTASLILTKEERAYLERQVRGRRVARSLLERCRIILRCADGIASKVVAIELGVYKHTVGKWRRRFIKDRIEGLLDEARPGRSRSIDYHQVAAVIEHFARNVKRRNALFDPLYGRRNRLLPYDNPSNLECFRAAAPSRRDVQALE
jgi:transposase-like protein